MPYPEVIYRLGKYLLAYQLSSRILGLYQQDKGTLFVKWQELFVKNISGISGSLRILGLTVLSRQGYMSGKNYLLKISLAYLGLYESLAFTVLSRQGYKEGKAYLSSSKNYVFVKNISGISLSLRILGLYYLDKGTWRARIICQVARTIC